MKPLHEENTLQDNPSQKINIFTRNPLYKKTFREENSQEKPFKGKPLHSKTCHEENPSQEKIVQKKLRC